MGGAQQSHRTLTKMPTVPEELDVFYAPHRYMKMLVQDIEDLMKNTNFTNFDEYLSFLHNLSQRFHVFKTHEEIENNYILQALLPRISNNVKTTLSNDLHSDNRIADLMNLVDSAPKSGSNQETWSSLGEQIKGAIAEFTVDFIPHMNEEEEVFMPLLMEHFTESELRELTLTVMELHHINKTYLKEKSESQLRKKTSQTPTSPSLVDLPPEILIKIFSYLGPLDLCRMSQVHSSFSDVSFDGSLWRYLHPVCWAEGHWDFFIPLHTNKELSHSDVIEYNTAKKLLAFGDSVNARLCLKYEGCTNMVDNDNMRVEKEIRIMDGLINYLLPKVGPYVDTLDLAYGISVTSEMVNQMLKFCPNVHHLDLSHTSITDLAFQGLVDPTGNREVLEYIDLSGCSLITDTSLLRIAWACSPSSPTPRLYCTNCSCGNEDNSIIEDPGGKEPMLQYLILAGCHLITDVGLRALALGSGLPQLRYLELSGLSRISARGLNELVSACPRLKPEHLFYCDNVQNGPHSTEANGCQDEGGVGCCRSIFQT